MYYSNSFKSWVVLAERNLLSYHLLSLSRLKSEFLWEFSTNTLFFSFSTFCLWAMSCSFLNLWSLTERASLCFLSLTICTEMVLLFLSDLILLAWRVTLCCLYRMNSYRSWLWADVLWWVLSFQWRFFVWSLSFFCIYFWPVRSSASSSWAPLTNSSSCCWCLKSGISSCEFSTATGWYSN